MKLDIVGLPQRFHPHIVIHAQQNVFRIRTGKEVHLEKKATEREPVRQDDMPPAVCSAQCSFCPRQSCRPASKYRLPDEFCLPPVQRPPHDPLASSLPECW